MIKYFFNVGKVMHAKLWTFPRGIVSYVADSFDFWAVLTDILPALKDVILNREAGHVARVSW